MNLNDFGDRIMTKVDELNLFLESADDLIESKYIIADVKLANFLRSIAMSDTIIAILKNCLNDFDYMEAQRKYFVKSQQADKGEFVTPASSRELLAFVFNILVDIDAKRIDFNQLLSRYFFVDGSRSAAYEAFTAAMIKPFVNVIKMLMEGVVDGTIQDPIEALNAQEGLKAKELAEKVQTERRERELLMKAYGKSLKAIRDILAADKQKVKDSKLKDTAKEEITLVIDMLDSVLESDDKDAIQYAFIAYKNVAKANVFMFFGRVGKVTKLIKDVLNGI